MSVEGLGLRDRGLGPSRVVGFESRMINRVCTQFSTSISQYIRNCQCSESARGP